MTLDNGQTTVADRSRANDGKSFRNVSIRGGGHLTDINLKPCQNETLSKLQVFQANKFFGATLNDFGSQGQYVTHFKYLSISGVCYDGAIFHSKK